MIFSGGTHIGSRKGATVVITPPLDVVPVRIRIPTRPVDVLDIKIGKNSQGAGITHFMSDMLSDMPLRLDRTHGVLNLALALYNDSDDEVGVEVELEAVPASEAGARLAVPLGFFDSPSRDKKYPHEMTQDSFAPGETRTLLARTQAAGLVRRVLLSRNVLCDVKIRTLARNGRTIAEHAYVPVTEFRGVGIEARLRVELAYRREDCAQDCLELEVTNRGTLPISARDFAAVVEDVEHQDALVHSLV